MNRQIGLLRQQALAIFQMGVAAADPYRAVQNYLHSDGVLPYVRLNNGNTRSHRWTKIHVAAFGKAAYAMAKAARDCLPAVLLGNSITVTNHDNATPLADFEVLVAGHPLPDAAGLAAAKRLADIANQARQHELLLVLVSGGGSALLPYPADGITLAEKGTTTDLLLASGATINEINCVRKHLSRIKGGGLAKLAYPADVHAMILSDVLGDDVSAIASGPTVPDATTYIDAIAILKNHEVWEKIPLAVQQHLQQGERGLIPETPKPDDIIFYNTSHTLVGSNAISVAAMLKITQNLGYQTQLYSDKLCGEAREVAKQWVSAAKQLNQPMALIAGGETTVTLTGNGRGGRNQEMALAFAIAAEQQNLTGNWVFLSGGTDGRDGPTDAAGGMVDADSYLRMLAKNCDPLALLNNNDAYTALSHSEDLLKLGATGTNVADLQILLFVPG